MDSLKTYFRKKCEKYHHERIMVNRIAYNFARTCQTSRNIHNGLVNEMGWECVGYESKVPNACEHMVILTYHNVEYPEVTIKFTIINEYDKNYAYSPTKVHTCITLKPHINLIGLDVIQTYVNLANNIIAECKIPPQNVQLIHNRLVIKAQDTRPFN